MLSELCWALLFSNYFDILFFNVILFQPTTSASRAYIRPFCFVSVTLVIYIMCAHELSTRPHTWFQRRRARLNGEEKDRAGKTDIAWLHKFNGGNCRLRARIDAVGDQVDVILDGGIRRGTHVLKAIAAGAKACSGGRMYLYALAAAGQRR